MDSNANDQRQAVKYLLGELSEEEQARLEERFFNDAALSEVLSEAEDDLIDQYVRDDVSALDRKRIENHFLVSERRREKVKFARALLQAEQANPAPAIASGRQLLPWWKGLLSASLAPRPALSYALAAVAFLFLVGGIWLFSEIRQLRSQIAQFEADRERHERQNQQLNEQVVEQGRRSEELAAQKEKLEQDILQLQQQADSPERQQDPLLSMPLSTFILLPGARGSEGPQKLTIPAGARSVRLQLNLRPGDEYPAYEVTLRTASGQLVSTWSRLVARSTRGELAVFVNVPAKLLSADQYELTLNGVARSGRSEGLGYYYFNLQQN